jgi:type III secretion protein Q
VERVLHAAHAGLRIDTIHDDLIGMLLESVLADDLPMIERAAGTELAIARATTEKHQQGLALALRCAYDGATHDCTLALDRDLARDLCQLLARIPSAKVELPDLPVRLAISLGSAQLPLQEVDDLAPGDVILPHSPPLAAGKAQVTLAHRWAAAGNLTATSFTLTERLRDTTEPTMDIDNDSSERAEVEDVELDDLPIKLVFEVGRCDMTLGAVRALGPGHVFALDRDPAQPVDIVANGRRIGTGQLVRVGERIGIRVQRLGQDG